MTLADILPRVQTLLGDIGCSHVTIRRSIPVNEQHVDLWSRYRFEPDRDQLRGYTIHKFGLTGWRQLPDYGEHFAVEDVLATNWEIATS